MTYLGINVWYYFGTNSYANHGRYEFIHIQSVYLIEKKTKTYCNRIYRQGAIYRIRAASKILRRNSVSGDFKQNIWSALSCAVKIKTTVGELSYGACG